MNVLCRPLLRTVALRATPFAFRPPRLARPAVLNSTLLHARTVASSVSNRPGSQTLEQAATNIKEEVGSSAADLAKAIAGASATNDTIVPAKAGSSFFSITGTIASEVPEPVFAFGLVGGLPYLLTSGTTIYLAHTAGMAAMGQATDIDPGIALTFLDQALNIQVTYGAVMLSFLGALHWGMEFAGYGGEKGYKRLALGAAPVLFAWPTLALQPTGALIAQWVGFTALWYADSRVTSIGWAPKWFSQYRFYLTLLVGSCIIASLAGISYYGPVAGHGLVSHDLDVIRAEREKYLTKATNTIPGPIEAVPAREDEAYWFRVHKKGSEEKGENKEE